VKKPFENYLEKFEGVVEGVLNPAHFLSFALSFVLNLFLVGRKETMFLGYLSSSASCCWFVTWSVSPLSYSYFRFGSCKTFVLLSFDNGIRLHTWGRMEKKYIY
jgi:hypothetical protein